MGKPKITSEAFDVFNLSKSMNGEIIFVETRYSEYQIIYSTDKGTAIYLMIEGMAGTLVKQYRGLKLDTAINYLLKKSLFIN